MNVHDIRMKVWYLIALVSTGALFYLYPQQAGTLLWKLNVISLSLLAAYWADRSLFPFARPGEPENSWLRDVCFQFRRVVLMGSVVIAVSNIA